MQEILGPHSEDWQLAFASCLCCCVDVAAATAILKSCSLHMYPSTCLLTVCCWWWWICKSEAWCLGQSIIQESWAWVLPLNNYVIYYIASLVFHWNNNFQRPLKRKTFRYYEFSITMTSLGFLYFIFPKAWESSHSWHCSHHLLYMSIWKNDSISPYFILLICKKEKWTPPLFTS